MSASQGVRLLTHKIDERSHIILIVGLARDYYLSADTRKEAQDLFDTLNSCLKSHNISHEAQEAIKEGYLVKQGKNRKVYFIIRY